MAGLAQAGVWQRWRLVNAAPSRFLDLTVTMIDDDTPTGCQIALLAKDGVFLLDMPRLVNHAMLVGAARCAAPGPARCSWLPQFL